MKTEKKNLQWSIYCATIDVADVESTVLLESHKYKDFKAWFHATEKLNFGYSDLLLALLHIYY